jgi:hypothetical protein
MIRPLSRYHGGSGALVLGMGSWVIKIGRSQTGRQKLCHEALYLKSLRHTPAERLYVDSIGPDILNRVGILIMHRVEGVQAREAILNRAEAAFHVELIEDAGAQLAKTCVATRRKVDSNFAAVWASSLAHDRAVKAGKIFGEEVRLAAANLLEDIDDRASYSVLRTPCAASIHGDAHLGNLILVQDSYKWLDPRGFFIDGPSFDPAYDIGKMAHEPALVEGMYGDSGLARVLEGYSRKLQTAYIEPWRSVDPNVGRRACFYAAVNLLSATTFGQIKSDEAAKNMLRIAGRFLSGIETRSGIEGVEWFG